MITPLLGSDIYTLTNSINLGYSIDITLFYSLLATIQMKVESKRDWIILRKTDTSESANPSDNFQTAKTLPSDFFFWQSEKSIVLVDSSSPTTYIEYWEVPLANQFEYQTQCYRYFVDYANSHIYLGGVLDRTYTIYKNYIYQPDKITDTTSWVFPAKFHELLAFGVAALNKLGIDFDDINKLSGDDNGKTFLLGLQAMEMWDAKLSTNMLRGVDRRIDDGVPGFLSGHIGNIN